MDVDQEKHLRVCKVLENPNPVLFCSKDGAPMTFHAKVSPDEKDLSTAIALVVNAYGGNYVTYYKDMYPHTVLLVTDDGFKKGPFNRPAVCLTYIGDCVHSDSLLDIKEYLHPWEDKQRWSKLDFFAVVYSRVMKFQCYVPEDEETKSPNTAALVVEHPVVEIEDDDLDDENWPNEAVTEVKQRGRGAQNKYRMFEKEAILKFLVTNRHFYNLRGDRTWKLMAKKKICPSRTWQSMKNHFLKKLLHELDNFEFVLPHHKERFLNPTSDQMSTDDDSGIFNYAENKKVGPKERTK